MGMKIILFSNKENAEKHRNGLRRNGWRSVNVGYFNHVLKKDGEDDIVLEIMEPSIRGTSLFRHLNSEAGDEYRAQGIEVDISDVIAGIDKLREDIKQCAIIRK